MTERTGLAEKQLDEIVAEKEKVLKSIGRVTKADDARVTQLNAATAELNAAKTSRQLWLAALSVSNPAQAPDAAVWPKKFLTLFAAVLVGLGLGSGVALLTARVDNRLKGDELRHAPGAVLVRVPLSPRAPKNSPLGADPRRADRRRQLRRLGRASVLDRFGDGAHVVLVTSARSGEGKSSVAANLASALALGGRRVVLVDADMRRPTLDQVFPMLQNRPGLSRCSRGAPSSRRHSRSWHPTSRPSRAVRGTPTPQCSSRASHSGRWSTVSPRSARSSWSMRRQCSR